MKFAITILPLAALSTAFVILDEQLTSQVLVESLEAPKSFIDKVSDKTNNVFSDIRETVNKATENAFDAAMDAATSTKEYFTADDSMSALNDQGWLESHIDNMVDDLGQFDLQHPQHPRHGHRHTNKTIYELINESKYTTKLAEFINEYSDLVDALNDTNAKYTMFAPTNKAFEELFKHFGEKPSKEAVKRTIEYHISPEFYPARRVLVSHTIPTTLHEESLGGRPQRLRVRLGLRGLTVNYHSRIVAADIFGSNGVVHGVDSIIPTPWEAASLLTYLPDRFSTLTLALEKTGLIDMIAEKRTSGGTLFAPSNWAFQKLGHKINVFLFSPAGEKHLKALLEYHIIPLQTVYSDAYYCARKEEEVSKGVHKNKHFELQTAFKSKSLSVDIARWAGFITMKINGFTSVTIQDGVAEDGVIHMLSSVLIPPKSPGGVVTESEIENLTVEDLVDRLESVNDEL